MFQKFFTDTMASRFIKNLLASETIPLLEVVSDGHIVIENCLYIYRGFVIKCTRSGKLLVSESEELFPSDTLFPSVMLVPGTGIIPAQFYVIAAYDTSSAAKFSYSYKSNVHWYDSDTHKHLGNYLRFLRDYKGLDLMPYYNCYNAYEIGDVHLTLPATTQLHPSDELFPDYSLHPGLMRYSTFDKDKSTYYLDSTDIYRVVAVPIRFNQTYTIAIECPAMIQFRGVIYNSSGMVKVPNTEDKYYSDELHDSYIFKSCTRFNEPFLYSIETSNKELYDRQKDLYLLIQLPISNRSSIVVLEGDFTKRGKIETNSQGVRQYGVHKNLSLLMLNSYENYAFSNRLIEFLLTNVITHLEEFSTNIHTTQRMLYKLDHVYKNFVDGNKTSWGVWDDAMKHAVLRVVEDASDDYYFYDQDGYINKDVEEIFLRAGGYRS